MPNSLQLLAARRTPKRVKHAKSDNNERLSIKRLSRITAVLAERRTLKLALCSPSQKTAKRATRRTNPGLTLDCWQACG